MRVCDLFVRDGCDYVELVFAIKLWSIRYIHADISLGGVVSVLSILSFVVRVHFVVPVSMSNLAVCFGRVSFCVVSHVIQLSGCTFML